MKFWKYFVLGSSKHCFSLFLKPNAAGICSPWGTVFSDGCQVWSAVVSEEAPQHPLGCSCGVVHRNPSAPLFLGPPDLPRTLQCSRAWELRLLTQSCAARQVLPGDTGPTRLPRKLWPGDSKSSHNQENFYETYWFWHITINQLPIPD